MPLGTNGALSMSSRDPASLPPPTMAGWNANAPVERAHIGIDEQLRRD